MEILYTALLITNIIVLLALCLFIFCKNRRSIFNRIFSYMILAGIVWQITYLARYSLIPIIRSKADAFFWINISHYSA
ncbi:MAG: hypothetical protein KKE64_05780, partial [Candidatus Omnitrophica bacterium]|nr:hypothetical protein [Candidatus Omnitrophota bacterium]